METTIVCRFCLSAITDDKFIDLEKDGCKETIKTREKLKLLFTQEVSFLLSAFIYCMLN